MRQTLEVKVNSQTGLFWDALVEQRTLARVSYYPGHKFGAAYQEYCVLEVGETRLHIICNFNEGTGPLRPIKLTKRALEDLFKSSNPNAIVPLTLQAGGFNLFWGKNLIAYADDPCERMAIKAVQRGRVKPIYAFK